MSDRCSGVREKKRWIKLFCEVVLLGGIRKVPIEGHRGKPKYPWVAVAAGQRWVRSLNGWVNGGFVGAAARLVPF